MMGEKTGSRFLYLISITSSKPKRARRPSLGRAAMTELERSLRAEDQGQDHSHCGILDYNEER